MKHVKTKIKIKKELGSPLAVVGTGNLVCMLSRLDSKTTSSLFLSWSEDGINFQKDDAKVSIEVSEKKKEKIKDCARFSLSRTPNGFVLIYVRLGKTRTKTKDMLVVARSKDLYSWRVMSELPADGFHRATIAYDKPLDTFELYMDGLFLRSQSSATLAVWKRRSSLLITSRRDHFDAENIGIIGSLVVPEGILVVYDASIHKQDKNSQSLLQAGAVLFDINDPKRIRWRSEVPVWQGVIESKSKNVEVHPIGSVYLKNKFKIYWITSDGVLLIATIPALFKELEAALNIPKILDRFHGNPIIASRHDHAWEGEGTFNPGVIQDDEGIVHILYRALGRDGISRVGYAQSKNGLSFDKRLSYPVFEPRMGHGMPDPGKTYGPTNYNPAMYTSGGGWGGAEDPRAVKIGDTIYMMYVAFEGWNSMRIALTSISIADFKAGRWHWKQPRLISAPGKMAKNWLLFPEKIHGKYVIIHGIVPKVMIEYIDDIDTFDGIIHSPRPEGAPQPGRAGKWDGLIRGAGPPPIKTDLGWLLLYHALDKRDSSRYKLGAMILDKNDPTKVLHRSLHPILAPDMHYENDGKPGIVYASGAIIRDGELYVYYGGGDKVTCVATTPLKNFLEYLVTGKPGKYEMKKAEK